MGTLIVMLMLFITLSWVYVRGYRKNKTISQQTNQQENRQSTGMQALAKNIVRNREVGYNGGEGTIFMGN